MENKRITRKLNSVFWWVLMVLPIIFILLSAILLIVHYRAFDYNHLSIEYINETFSDWDFWNNAIGKFNDFSIDGIYNVFDSLFVLLGVRDNWDLLATIFAYMLSIEVYHLIFDFLSFIFVWLHDFFERG